MEALNAWRTGGKKEEAKDAEKKVRFEEGGEKTETKPEAEAPKKGFLYSVGDTTNF